MLLFQISNKTITHSQDLGFKGWNSEFQGSDANPFTAGWKAMMM